jgi:hypothetical protein
MYKTVYTEVDVDMSDFNTEDLIEELESRGGPLSDRGGDTHELIRTIYQLRRTGQDYQQELDKLIWAMIGKVS